MQEAGRFFAWAQLRASWRRRLALAVLIGVVGAVAIGSAAGAVRTATAVDRFIVEQRAFDALVFCGPSQPSSSYPCEEQLRGAASVADTTAVFALSGLLSVDGRNLEVTDDSCYSGPGNVQAVVSPDGRFGTDINTHRFIAGGPPDPAKADEVVISRELARRAELGVGDTIDLQLFAGVDCLDDPAGWQPTRTLTITGIEVSPFEVAPDTGDYLALVHGTPALLDEISDHPDLDLVIAARFRPGATFDDLVAELGDLGPAFADFGTDEGAAVPATINSDNLKKTAHPFVVAQWLVAGLAAAIGLILLGQMLSRQIRSDASDFRALGQLGLTRRDLLGVGAAHLLSVAVPAAVVAAAGSWLTSSLTPLGVAKVVEVDPGLRADPAVMAIGALALVVGLVLVNIPALFASARRRAPAGTPLSGRAGTVARHLGGGPVSTTGLRMAFEPLRGPTAPPLRTGFGVILLSVVLLVAATLFAGSITRLLDSDHLVGWNWDALLYVEDDGGAALTADRLGEAARATDGVDQATPGTIFPPLRLYLGPDRTEMQAFSFADGGIAPTMISGRPPRGPDEIVLGRVTMSRLGYRQGQTVPYVAEVGTFEEVVSGNGTEVPGEVTIVGTAVVPSGGGDNRLGTGAAVDLDFFLELAPDTTPDGVFVRLDAGARLDEVTSAVAEASGAASLEAITAELLGPQLVDVEQVRDLPIALAAVMALLAIGVTAQVIVSSAHARRTELGVLRAIGLRPRQLRSALVVQAVAISGAALLVGVPLGIVVGRQVWRRFALGLGTKPEVELAIGWLVAATFGLLVLAALLGLAGSARTRRRLATALRRE